MRRRGARPVREAGRENPPMETSAGRPGPTSPRVNIRLDEEKLCLLVLIGVRVDGTKELIALADGYRESTGSWADLLRDCEAPRHARPGPGRRRRRARVLARAARGVPRDAAEQRCWFHRDL